GSGAGSGGSRSWQIASHWRTRAAISGRPTALAAPGTVRLRRGVADRSRDGPGGAACRQGLVELVGGTLLRGVDQNVYRGRPRSRVAVVGVARVGAGDPARSRSDGRRRAAAPIPSRGGRLGACRTGARPLP